MTTNSAAQSVTTPAFILLWTLVSRAVGLTAGLAVAMLLMAALISAR